MRVLIKFAIIMLTLAGALCREWNPLISVAEWKDLDYEFPSATDRTSALSTGKWIPGNGVPIDVGVYYGGASQPKIFVTIPRDQTGVPITLGIISNNSSNKGPLITPYPDYSWHSSHGLNCDGITSVFRVAIDECNRLWVLDTGIIGGIQYCPPQIVVFHLKTNTLLRRYKFPASQYKNGSSLFVTPIVDVRDPKATCANTMVYIADVDGFGINVYSYGANTSWRAQNILFNPDERYGKFTISSESFDLLDGVLGMTVSGQIGYQLAAKYSTAAFPVYAIDRLLYFHALSAGTENIIPLRYLDNQSIWMSNVEAIPKAFIVIGSRGIQSAAEAMDSNRNIFFGLATPNAIACWNSNNPYDSASMRLVAESELKLQFASGLKIVKNADGLEELWTLTCRFQKVMTGSINYNEVNFRIQRATIESLLGGTRCGP